MWPDENVIVTTDEGSKTEDTHDKIKLVNDRILLKDYNPVKIKTSPEIKETIIWESTDSKIVDVNNAGEIHAVAKEGNAEVKAVYNEQELICHVEVDIDKNDEGNEDSEQPEIEISNGAYPDECNLQVGQTRSLNIKFSDHYFDESKLSWVSKDNSIVQVDKKGRIKALSIGKTEVCLCFEDKVTDKIIINVTEKK